MKTVGIIGFGSFGKFLAEKLSSYSRVMVYSQSGQESSWSAPLDSVVQCDYLLLAIPLDAYDNMLSQIKPLISDRTVIVDVCSVKVEPIRKIRAMLPDQPLVATHPMFGPESASVSLQDHTFIMCPESSDPVSYEQIKQFVAALGLGVIELSAEQHDREIATVQGLTFFIARALADMHIHDQTLHTPSFGRLLRLAELEKHHSPELFETIQNGNPYSASVREAFIDRITAINDTLHPSERV